MKQQLALAAAAAAVLAACLTPTTTAFRPLSMPSSSSSSSLASLPRSSSSSSRRGASLASFSLSPTSSRPSSSLAATATSSSSQDDQIRQAPQQPRRQKSLQKIQHHLLSLSPKARTILTALPVVFLAATLVFTHGPAIAQAAAKHAASSSSSLPSSPQRINKVREYVLKPLGESVSKISAFPPLKALRSTTHSLSHWATHGPLAQFLTTAWNEPAARYMLDPTTTPLAPNDIAGHVLEAIQARVPPTWSPLAVVALLSFLPIFEARVGVPFGLALGAPWLKALVVGVASNALVIPVAAGLGAFFRDVNTASPLIETATAARERYQNLERRFQELQGGLALKARVLEEEEGRLRSTIDTAIAVVRKGEMVMDLATRQGLVKEITEASRVLLGLTESDAKQFAQRLEEQFFETSVGSVMPESEGAFEDVSVAALGQRRVELAWHPDVTLFPMLGQAVVKYQLDEIAAQAQADFTIRPRELGLLREEVRRMREEVGREGAKLKELAKREAEIGRETVRVARELDAGVITAEDKAQARKAAMAKAKEEAAAAAASAAGGPGKFVPIADREKEEEARVAELQMQGKLMRNYGWPKAVVYVGLPLPFSGVWTAMFWSRCLGMKFGPSAGGALVGLILSTLIGLGLWLTGPVGVLLYALVLAVMYGEDNPVVAVGKALTGLKEGLADLFKGGKKKEGGGRLGRK